MSVHISRIEIRNFRNFGHLVLDPFPARAVIVGENGVGKSNLLYALRLVLDPRMSDDARRLRVEDVWEGVPGGLAAGVEVSVVVELQGFDEDDDAKSVLNDAIVDDDPYTARLTYRYAHASAVAGAAGSEADDTADEAAPDGQPAFTVADYDFVLFSGEDESLDARRIGRYVGLRVLHALRDAETDLQNWRRNPLRDLLERLPLDPNNLAAATTAITTAVDTLRSDPSVTELETRLSAQLRQMTGARMPMTPSLGFASTQPDELVRAIRLFIDPSRRHQVADASLGSANVLYLGLLLQALAAQRAAEEFVTTMVAVEEPEAHLHVSLQRRLFRHLLRSESTLILTTHSPQIAAVAPLHSLVLLRDTPAGTVGRTTAALDVSAAVATDLERYLDVNRAELLFCSAVILVEGAAELYILPALAAAAGFDLDSWGVVVASVQGSDFAPFVALLGAGGVDTPWCVVTDGDPGLLRQRPYERGLRRGAALLADDDHERLLEQIEQIEDHSDDQARDQIAAELGDYGVFVGRRTLEVDLAGLFGPEIVTAFKELSTNRPARIEVQAGVDDACSGTPSAEAGRRLVRRIEKVGKGRFAQRLAAHLDLFDADDLRNVLANAGGDPDSEPLVSGYADHVFGALDHVSQLVRHTGLFGQADDSETIPDGQPHTNGHVDDNS